MGSTIAAVVMVVVLAARHLKTRRHASWKVSADARFYITSGYPLVAIAVYFLTSATSNTDWAWVVGNLWALVAMTGAVREQTGLGKAVLSGGCFQNRVLLEGTVRDLEKAGFEVYTHQMLPSNDGCIALGQAVVAAAQLQARGTRIEDKGER